MAEEVKLYALTESPYVFRVVLALKLKGVQYEHIEEKLSDKSPELLKYNPVHKKVPVLLHNGKPIVESSVIIEYIDETWKEKPILPEDPHEKAVARFWAKFIDETFMPTVGHVFYNKGDIQKWIEDATEPLKMLENELNGKKFFGGDDIGFVDISASFISFWLGAFEEVLGCKLMTKEKFPKLTTWANEYINHSVVKENLPPRDGLVAFIRNRFGKA